MLLLATGPSSPAEFRGNVFALSIKRVGRAKNDPEAVIALSDLRLFYQNGQFSKAAFLKEYPLHFAPAVRTRLATAKPVKEPGRDTYSVFCGEEIFTFEKVNGAYKFTDIGVND